MGRLLFSLNSLLWCERSTGKDDEQRAHLNPLLAERNKLTTRILADEGFV